MSGFEIAGVILGALPIVFKAAEGYKQGFAPFAKWINYKYEFKAFVDQVHLQMVMFNGSCELLLQNTELSQEQRDSLLSGQDVDQWHTEVVKVALKKRLGRYLEPSIVLLKSMVKDLMQMQAMLCLKDGSVDWVKPGVDKWRYQRKRVCQSFSSKGPETIASFVKSNKELRDVLDLLDKLEGDRTPQRQRQVPKDPAWVKLFQNIRNHANNLHSAIYTVWKCSCKNPHSALMQLQRRCTTTDSLSLNFVLNLSKPEIIDPPDAIWRCARVIVTSKMHRDSVADCDVSPWLVDIKEGYLAKLTSNLNLDSPVTEEKMFYNEAAFVENAKIPPVSRLTALKKRLRQSQSNSTGDVSDKSADDNTKVIRPKKPARSVRFAAPPLGPHSQSAPPGAIVSHTPPLSKTGVQITDLCATINTIDSDPSYFGYLEGTESCVHDLRCLSDTTRSKTLHSTDLVTLNDLLDPSQKTHLSRKERFSVAIVLASSLLQLQTTPWTTGTFTKNDILFERVDNGVFSKYPYIQHSFSAGSIANSSGSTSERFEIIRLTRASLTSLGVVLLELGFGAPIEAQHKYRDQHLAHGQANDSTDFMTARDWVNDVEDEIGDEYYDAVKACIDIEGRPDWTDENFIATVHARVVQNLEIAFRNNWKEKLEF